MASRINNAAPIGSLLDKRSRSKKVRPEAPGQRRPRRKDDAYLKLIRVLPCIKCGRSPCDAAHVRMGGVGELPTGMGRKPDDSRCLPLCHEHHMEQHAIGESPFWSALGIDPLEVAAKLFSEQPELVAMRRVILEIQMTRK